LTAEGGRDKRWALFEQRLRERGLATAIPKAARSGGALPASPAQERLLFLEQLTPGSAVYNDHYALRLRGRLDAARLRQALDEIARRHEALRTTFAFGAQGDALQVLHDSATIPCQEASWVPGGEPFEAWVVAEGVKEARTAFDLFNGPLSRARLLSRSRDEHVLLFTIHHAVWDGWSSGVLARELTALYGTGASKPAALPELTTQYADYSEWQRSTLRGELLERKLTFWRRELADAPAAIDLPTDRARPREQTFEGKTLRAKLGPALSASVDARARQWGRTPFSVLCATFGVLLARHGDQRDLVIATPTANRQRVELEALIGCFVNTIALRLDLSGEPTLETLVAQLGDRLQRAEPHQDLPFERLVDALGVERDSSRSPVAQVMFVLQNTPPRALEMSGVELTPLELDAGFAKLDLTLEVAPTTDGYATAWQYNTDLFDEPTIERLMRRYEQLLKELLAAPTTPVFRLGLLRPDERRTLLYDWNQTSSAFPEETLHELFARQARRSPDAVAVIVGTQRFTYAELDAQARGVARALVARGAGPGDLVAVFLRRDRLLLPGLLGALMCGAAYVPLDPAYPRDRLALILDDTNPAALLTTAELVGLVPEPFRERGLDLTRVAPAADHGDASPGRAGDRAYVIYTSGSTGRPKGVEIEHGSAVAFVSWAHGVFGPADLSGVLAATSICFDLSIFEIFGTLLAGGTVIVADNALSLADLPARSEVTLVNTVPSAAAELLRSAGIPTSVRTVSLAGEPLPEQTVLRLYDLPHVERVYNLYGPSETTTYSTYALTTPRAWTPIIGRPIANTRAYVLDEHLEPTPLGVRGELYLAGAGVARGYLGRPELTAERFLPDPFWHDGSRMYKTGDVVRWRASGELEYFGRNDHQVKLRGFRIELGEIEAALRRQASVADAAALVREDVPGIKTLVAYVVPSQGGQPSVDELRAGLGRALPEYMVPARFVVLEGLPLSPNGKVDRKRLPAPAARGDEPLVAPRSADEQLLAGIWQEVLHLERVSVRDSFFELGGDSIAAMRMTALARRAGLELSVSQIFQSPSIEALAERVTHVRSATRAEPLPDQPFPLSPIQRWFFERGLTHPHHYNQSVRVTLRAGTDVAALERAVRWTVERHSTFRLRFEAGAQRYGAAPRVDVRTYDVSGLSLDAKQAALDTVSNELEGSLDFASGALGRVALFDPRGTAEGALFFVLHHLVVDVVSWHVLLSDIARAYAELLAGAPTPTPVAESSSYAEYVARLGRRESPAATDGPHFPRLPRDFDDGPNVTRSRDTVGWTLDAAATADVTTRARDAYRLGVEDVTLAALCRALRHWTQGELVAVDVERHGRDLPGLELELSDSVGWFTELVPLVFDAPDDARASLLAVKAALHEAPERARVRPTLAEREVVYNFLGNLGEQGDVSSPFVAVRASSATSNHHPDNARSHLLEVSVALRHGALEVEIAFSRNVHTRAAISRLQRDLSREFAILAGHLDSRSGAYTPGDFPLARLDQAELDAHHASWWRKLEDAYVLTPAQHAIVVDVLRDPSAGYYVPQLQVIVSALDPAQLDESLTWLLQRHSALRTAFAWSGLSEPVQLVFEEVACPSRHEDWRTDAEPARRARLAEFLARDRQRGFALEHAPLLRLLHVRWTDTEDLLVWTIHHAISDGWSLPILMSELLTAYAALAQNRRPGLPSSRPFRDYVSWLVRQDHARAEAYFQDYLRDVRPIDLGIAEDPSYRRIIESTATLDPVTSGALEQLARRHSVTLGVVIQAAWALVLARYSAKSDVTFGSVDSGRPDALERAADMVGMFVTTLPLRVNVDPAMPIATLLADVRTAALGLREHAYASLAQVAAASGQPRLFQSICVIENYPALSEGAGADVGLRELVSHETTRFPLTVSAATRGRIELAVSASFADSSAGPELLEAWRSALEQMSTAGASAVSDIELPRATRRRAARAHWQALLDDAPAALLFTDRPRTAGEKPRPATLELPIVAALGDAVASLARRSSADRASVLLAAFAVLLGRHAAERELLIAVEVGSEPPLVARAQLDAASTFEAQVTDLDRQLRAGRDNFDVSALRELAGRARVAFGTVDASLAHDNTFELSLAIRSAAGPEVAVWRYDGALFDPTSVARIGQQLNELLLAAAAQPTRRLRELGLAGAVGVVSAPPAATGGATTVLDLIRARAREAPTALAVLSSQAQLSYAELDACSSAVAARLRARGVKSGDLVAVQVQRSPAMVVVLLGVIKAGAAYVALDSATPAERCRYMLHDSGARICVVDRRPVWTAAETSFVDAASLLAEHAEPTEDNDPADDDLAYVIYTSGSSGQPKGVMVEHASLLNYMAFYAQATGVGPADRLLQFASASFDVSVEEIFGALCFGATLVLRPDDITPRELLSVCQALGVSIVSFPTAYFNEVTRALVAGVRLPDSLRLVLIGGESVSRAVTAQWQGVVGVQRAAAAPVRLLNMYGPTEATISVTCADLSDPAATEREPAIGRPIGGSLALVVDADDNPVPVGVPGELLLGGRCLARGYLRRPELTTEKFVASALADRLYRTGDLVRWRGDGQLEYLRRLDQQVKLRGYRVELGEIEALLRRQPGVEDVVVVLRDDDPENLRLVAYVVGTATSDALRPALVELPEYMRPSAIVELERLPVTGSGKIDRRALALPPSDERPTGHVAPSTPFEAALLGIWQRILGSGPLGVDRSFFELGGHSLLATQVISRVQAELGLELSVRDFFEAPTVRDMAAILAKRVAKRADHSLRRLDEPSAPLSFAQTRLWFLDQLEPGSAASNMPLALRVLGKLDVASLARALVEVGRRHAVLRTRFLVDGDGLPTQHVEATSALELEVSEVPPLVEPDAWLLEQARRDARQPFDLATGPLLRARLRCAGPERYLLSLNLHHIVADGWSIGVLVSELTALYRAFAAGAASPLRELPVQYADYASWQREQLSGDELGRKLEFWKAELQAAPLQLNLPTRSGKRGQSYVGAMLHSELDATLADGVDALALELHATPFMILLAAWAVLLARVSGQADLVIGTPVANRSRVETEGLIGVFVNTLAVRVDLRGDPSFDGVVRQLRERLLRAEPHQDLPFEKLVDALDVERDLARTPIFQVMFAMQNTPPIAFDLPDVELQQLDLASDAAKFDLTINVERTPRGYASAWEYRTDLFEPSFIVGLAGSLRELLQAFIAAPRRAWQRAPLLARAEHRAQVVDFNRTDREFPDARVHELITARAARTPSALAVLDEHTQLSYAALESEAEKLAYQLVAYGACPETRIAVALDRSVRLVVALLAVQKSGAAYVPLDPTLPPARVAQILADARVGLVLGETSTSALLTLPPGVELVSIDRMASPDIAGGATLPRLSADTLAYVLFTSGSTGRPKGVEITHRALVNLLSSMQREPGISPSDRVLATTNLGFDIAGLELYLPLISGASVQIASRELATSAEQLGETLARRGVTFFQATPATYKMLLSAGFRGSPRLKLLVGGEPLSVELGRRLLACGASVWNVYGPTETTIWSTCAEVSAESLERGVDIGRPIDNTQAFVLDPFLEPVPAGVLGELYLGGAGLARGYAGRADLTAERFLPNPFGAGRLYRTGDVARRRSDGALECFGRVDHQVKVRGFRIELGEIEAALRRHPDVVDVAVAAPPAGADDRLLVAYVVVSAQVSRESLRAFLAAALPDYMLPAHFVTLDRLPTTPNGKLDRHALPTALQRDPRPGAVAPRDEIERKVAAIFGELLRLPEVSVFDDFFDLGGHSLLGTELVFRLRREFGVSLALKSLFETPTVAGLAAVVRAPLIPARDRLPDNVVLARQGPGVPWFCFPALAGTAAPYLPSVTSRAGSSVFLLEAPGVVGEGAPLSDVNALAARFFDAIRRVAPDGPVRLMGWSFGATTAFVAARLLASEGRVVEQLLLLDPALPGMTRAVLDARQLAVAFIVDVAESVGKLEDLRALSDDERARLQRRRPGEMFHVAKSLGIFPSSTTPSDFQRRFSVYTASARALSEFAPVVATDAYPGPAHIVSASAGNGRATASWQKLLPRARFTLVDASHYTILEHLRELLD